MPKNAPIGLQLGQNFALIIFFKNQESLGNLHHQMDPPSTGNVDFGPATLSEQVP